MYQTDPFNGISEGGFKIGSFVHDLILLLGLSHLIAKSVDEDRFGVVQKNLPEILASLLTLQQVNNLPLLERESTIVHTKATEIRYFTQPTFYTTNTRNRPLLNLKGTSHYTVNLL